MDPTQRQSVQSRGGPARHRRAPWLHRMRRGVADGRGMALITALFVVFFLGMMLFSFVFMMQSEAGFASLNRSSTLALHLAEAGAQEAIERLNNFGAQPGATKFVNSLAASGNCASVPPVNCVAYQQVFQSNPAIFPVLSTATYGGTQRAVRLLVQVNYKTGLGNVIYGTQVSYQGDSSPITGDTYALGSIALSQFEQTPMCSAGATATNLVSPQILAGATIGVTGNGANVNPPCGGPANVTGTYKYECANSSMVEVPPTPCPGGRAVVGGYTLPVWWHPMTPVGMTSTDFAAAATWINANPGLAASYGLSLAHAQQNAVDVAYSPVSYTPSYWSTIPGAMGKVLLVNAQQPFCVKASTGQVVLPSPAGSLGCPAGFTAYGSTTAGQPTRFLDWGLVQDDLTRATAQTFYQAPTCATCNAGGPNGYQNGVRYIPLPPSIDVLARACMQNVNPGTNVFDRVNTRISCPPPTQTISTTNVTFTGTKSSPEALIIDNAGQPAVSISGSLPGTDSLRCSNTNFDNYNWGYILSTGDVSISNKLVLTGFIYALGTVTSSDTTLIRGSVTTPTGNRNVVNLLASTGFCPGQATLVLSPVLFNYSTTSWQDVPANTP